MENQGLPEDQQMIQWQRSTALGGRSSGGRGRDGATAIKQGQIMSGHRGLAENAWNLDGDKI